MMKSILLSALSVASVGLLSAACGENPGSPPGSQVAASQDVRPAGEAGQDAAILAASRTTPEAFVRALFAVYSADPADATRDNTRFYTARTTALRARAIALNGHFDFDPILFGQDWDGLSVQRATVAMTDADHAVVDVIVRNFGQDASRRFLLVREAGGWRIDDMASTEMPSLVARIEADMDRDHPAS